jgi:hypothetical protein
MAGAVTLFAPGEVIASDRLRLTALNAESLEAMSWLQAALKPEWKLSDLEAAREASEGVLISDGLEKVVGLALLRLDCPNKGDATIPFLAMDPARRFRGLGGEAGLALEHQVREKLGVERFYVAVPEGRGLAVYFWLRLGYRPLTTGAAPSPVGLDGNPMAGIWMVREGS